MLDIKAVLAFLPKRKGIERPSAQGERERESTFQRIYTALKVIQRNFRLHLVEDSGREMPEGEV